MGHIHAAEIYDVIRAELGQSADVDVHATGRDLAAIFQSARGLALSFHALNEAYRQDLFVVFRREWLENAPIDHVPNSFVFDCHSHYFEKRGNHPGPQYNQGGRGNWWFFPEAYDFRGSLALGFSTSLNKTALHNTSTYEANALQTYRTLGGRFRLLVTPAPYAAGADALDGVNDTASFVSMDGVCDRLSSAAHRKIALPTGVIKNGRLELAPSPNLNKGNLWKVYPSGNAWTDPDQYFAKLADTLLTLRGQHTVCIHWWGDAAASASNLGVLARRLTNIRFVIFHACHPNFVNFRDLMREPNVFGEIGGVFANMILGGDGSDSISPTTPPPYGPARAVEMLRELRGRIVSGVGEHDKKIVWGTDAIWHGSSLWQVDAFKRLKLEPGHQRPETIAFKKRVLGGNAQQAFPVAYGVIA